MPTQIGENRAKKMLKANELVLCMGVNQLRTPNIAMIAAACGFDAVYIDLEHNPTSLETAAGVCVAALGMGITPIARVTSHDPHDATRILDCGAQGVMVPHVQNATEARAIVEACLYAPKRHRSAFGSGPQLGYVTGGNGQAVVARSLAPLVRDGQVILLIRGNTGGSPIIRRVLDDAGCRAEVDVAEMNNYPYSCWRLSPTRVRPIVRKRWLQIPTPMRCCMWRIASSTPGVSRAGTATNSMPKA
jgi:HpcH/HpaI aldolase/citrate lyase family